MGSASYCLQEAWDAWRLAALLLSCSRPCARLPDNPPSTSVGVLRGISLSLAAGTLMRSATRRAVTGDASSVPPLKPLVRPWQRGSAERDVRVVWRQV